MTDTVTLFTDGACAGNPGPGGWGVLMIRGGRQDELSGGAAHTTNNQMELLAAIKGLEALSTSHRVNIYTDSKYVKDGITQWIKNWKNNGWRNAQKKPVKNAGLWKRLDAAGARHDVTWHWVKGHDGHPQNERADRLANEGMRAYLEP